jgi:hypothetical protein
MSNRPPIPESVQTDVLTKCRRRCCICFGLNHDLTEKCGQIAHLDQNPSNHDPDNLAFLCLPHHDRYDGRTSQSKGLTITEVKIYRSSLWAAIERNEHQQSGLPPITNPKQKEILAWKDRPVSVHRRNGPGFEGFPGRPSPGWTFPDDRDYLIIDCNENYVQFRDLASGLSYSTPLENLTLQRDEAKYRLLIILKS